MVSEIAEADVLASPAFVGRSAASAYPQLIQKFAPKGFGVWQFGHGRGSGFPQFWQ
jgi:hypothetical protein